jgi:CubicO group peptidase (beta-lactamase class C family)
VAPGFEPVRDAFASVFADLGERGAAAAVWHDGRLVVDLWGGGAGAGRPWRADTLAHVYSVSKPYVAAAALALVGRGELALDEPVAPIWPELQAGRDGLTLRQALAHQAGLAAFREPVALTDWDATCAALARTAPWWPPGTAHGEHALTYGHLVGELVRRASGRRLDAVLREDIAGPAGLDFAFALDPDERARCADVETAAGWPDDLLAEGGALYRQALTVPPDALRPAVVNSAAWRAAPVPAVNGHGTARAVAAFYGMLIAGGRAGAVRVLDAGLVREALTPCAVGRDLVLERDVGWGLGPQIEGAEAGLGGIGGSVGYAHLDAGFGFGYVTRTLAGHDRADRVADAVEAALAA